MKTTVSEIKYTLDVMTDFEDLNQILWFNNHKCKTFSFNFVSYSVKQD